MSDSKRQERLRLALRANLRKRKAQARARQESPEEEPGETLKENPGEGVPAKGPPAPGAL